MTGRRTALILLAALCAAPPAVARSLFEEDRPVVTPAPAEAEIPLIDLVTEMAMSTVAGESGLDETIDVRISGGAPEWAARIEQFRLEPASGRFSALAVSGEGARTPITGVAQMLVTAYVPVRRIEAGEIVSESDLKEVSVPRSAINQNVVTDPEDILGMEARRPLTQDRPVLARSLIAPRAVEKGSPVLITLNEGGLDLTSPGKAMEDGGIGDIIRIVNTHSTKIIHAEIVGNGHVRAISAVRAQ